MVHVPPAPAAEILMSTVVPLSANVFPVPTKFKVFACVDIGVPAELIPTVAVAALNALYATPSITSPLVAPPFNIEKVDPSGK